MEKLYTLTLKWEEMDTLLSAVRTALSAETRNAEEFEKLAQDAAGSEMRRAAKDLAEMYRKDEAVYKALEDKLREAWT